MVLTVFFYCRHQTLIFWFQWSTLYWQCWYSAGIKQQYPGASGQYGIGTVCLLPPPNLEVLVPMVSMVLAVFVYCRHQTLKLWCQLWYWQCLYIAVTKPWYPCDSGQHGIGTVFFFILLAPNLNVLVPMVSMVLVVFIYWRHKIWYPGANGHNCIGIVCNLDVLVPKVGIVLTVLVQCCNQNSISQCKWSEKHWLCLYSAVTFQKINVKAVRIWDMLHLLSSQ